MHLCQGFGPENKLKEYDQGHHCHGDKDREACSQGISNKGTKYLCQCCNQPVLLSDENHKGDTSLGQDSIGRKGQELGPNSGGIAVKPKVKRKRKQKCIPPKKEQIKMVLAGDISIENVKVLMAKAVAGRFMDKKVKGGSLRDWLENNWRGLLGYLPKFHILDRRWICFKLGMQRIQKKFSIVIGCGVRQGCV